MTNPHVFRFNDPSTWSHLSEKVRTERPDKTKQNKTKATGLKQAQLRHPGRIGILL